MLLVLAILAVLAGERPSIVSIDATPAVIEMTDRTNARMIEVAVDVVVTDDSDPAPLVRLFRVTANEPLADDDFEITGTHTVSLRARQDETRIYTLHVEAIDRDGNRGVGTAEVAVRGQ